VVTDPTGIDTQAYRRVPPAVAGGEMGQAWRRRVTARAPRPSSASDAGSGMRKTPDAEVQVAPSGTSRAVKAPVF